MKQTILLLLLVTAWALPGQAQQKAPAGQVYGQAFAPRQAIPARDLPRTLGSRDSVAVQVTGQVREVCQVKGCWMDVQLTDNTVMKVRFKDYAFFVPKDLKGKTVVLNGKAYKQIISVADQRHYAQDAGKSAAAIQAIKAPKQSITYTASGVVLK
jgi:hypothetical protein